MQITCVVRDGRVDSKHPIDQGVILAEELTVNEIRDGFLDSNSELILHYRLLQRRWLGNNLGNNLL